MTDTIGFIGGGQMGEALIKGIIQAKKARPGDIFVAEPNRERQQYLQQTYKIQTHDSGKDVWQKCSTIILAVKPQIMALVLKESRDYATEDHLIISIAAGLPISFYEQLLDPSMRIIRVMPNTPALVLEGASALSGNGNATAEDMQKGLSLFESVGKAIVLAESYLDSVTGLSGSGPAFVFTFIEGLIDAGIKTGLARPDAETLAMQTVLGSVKLMMETGKHPAVLRAMVTSPGGTTIAGQHVLEQTGFRGIIMDAVETAVNRSRELGKQ